VQLPVVGRQQGVEFQGAVENSTAGRCRPQKAADCVCRDGQLAACMHSWSAPSAVGQYVRLPLSCLDPTHPSSATSLPPGTAALKLLAFAACPPALQACCARWTTPAACCAWPGRQATAS